MNNATLIVAAAFAFAAAASAKLPAPDDAAKAKAAETAAKTKWTDSVAAYQHCKAQDRIAASYRAQVQKQGKAASAPAQTPPCTDPGPFVYKPPEDKPLEAAGAHSPPATAKTPPSTPMPHGEATPKK